MFSHTPAHLSQHFARPSHASATRPDQLYLLFSGLTAHCDGLCTFGQVHRAVLTIARKKPV